MLAPPPLPPPPNVSISWKLSRYNFIPVFVRWPVCSLVYSDPSVRWYTYTDPSVRCWKKWFSLKICTRVIHCVIKIAFFWKPSVSCFDLQECTADYYIELLLNFKFISSVTITRTGYCTKHRQSSWLACCAARPLWSSTQETRAHVARGAKSRTPRIALSQLKLRSLVYNIPPPTTALIGYAIGLRELGSNGQFFFGVQMAATL